MEPKLLYGGTALEDDDDDDDTDDADDDSENARTPIRNCCCCCCCEDSRRTKAAPTMITLDFLRHQHTTHVLFGVFMETLILLRDLDSRLYYLFIIIYDGFGD